MLTEICQYLRNWFDRKPDGSSAPKYYGEFVIKNGSLDTDQLAEGQYYRILGSLFNDGVHANLSTDVLADEIFTGAVWTLCIPPAVVQLAADIDQWQARYGSIDSAALSPFQSESFAGYSYTKAGGSTSGGAQAGTWQAAFEERLEPWRKI